MKRVIVAPSPLSARFRQLSEEVRAFGAAEPDRIHVADFAEAGADRLLVPAEPSATVDLHRTLPRIRDHRKTPGAIAAIREGSSPTAGTPPA
jgi:pentose-5-phosphate-3-epimerase